MSTASGAIDARPRVRLGLVLGLLGVIAFSLTLPMTRLAVAQLDPWFVAFGRMSIAGAIAAAARTASAMARRRCSARSRSAPSVTPRAGGCRRGSAASR